MKKPEEIVITASLRVKNEEANLPRCLENLARFCDHIVAYDDGSTDRTLEILHSQPKVRYVVSMDKGYYHDSHDHSISTALATLTNPDWIMRIDADEILDEMGVRRIRELLAIPGYKAWSFPRFNCVGDEFRGDMAETHWCMYRYEPGKVFFYNNRNHSPYPCLDKVEGKWGAANLRIRHFGYVNLDAKLAKIQSEGYHFGDYLTPYFTWDEGAEDRPLLYLESNRPWYWVTSQEHLRHVPYDVDPEAIRYRKSQAEVDLWFSMAWNFITNLVPICGRQALDKTRQLIDWPNDFARRLRWRFFEGLLAYTLAQWDEADAAMAEVTDETQVFWPHQFFYATLYRERIAAWRKLPLTEPRDPLLVNGEALKDHYLQWFIENLQTRVPEDVYLFGAGRHSMYLDGIDFFPRLGIKGIIDDNPEKKAVNRLPIITLEEARQRGARLIVISTDAFEPQVMDRLRQSGIAENMIQPIYWTRGAKPFWFDEC